MAMKTLFLISLCFNHSVSPILAIYFYFPSAILYESCIIIIIIIILLPPHVGNQPNINLQDKAVFCRRFSQDPGMLALRLIKK